PRSLVLTTLIRARSAPARLFRLRPESIFSLRIPAWGIPPRHDMIKPLTASGKAFFAAVNLLGSVFYVWVLVRVLVVPAEPLHWGFLALLFMTLGAGIASVRIPGLNSLI